MTHVTCRLTAKNRDQLRNPTLSNEYGLPIYSLTRGSTEPPGVKSDVYMIARACESGTE